MSFRQRDQDLGIFKNSLSQSSSVIKLEIESHIFFSHILCSSGKWEHKEQGKEIFCPFKCKRKKQFGTYEKLGIPVSLISLEQNSIGTPSSTIHSLSKLPRVLYMLLLMVIQTIEIRRRPWTQVFLSLNQPSIHYSLLLLQVPRKKK